jgi:transcriptional regulator NrdR family protein
MSGALKINHMYCPLCGEKSLGGTADSRPVHMEAFGVAAHAVRRRRDCQSCGGRSTTFELTEEALHAIAHRVTGTNLKIGFLANQIAQLIEGKEP